MATRFRKSVNLGGGVKLNVSKKSVGLSAGAKGARVSANSSGRKTVTGSIPGTGFSASKSIGGGRPSSSGSELATSGGVHISDGFFSGFLIVMGIILTLMCLLLSVAVPAAGIIGVVCGILMFCYGRKVRKRLKNPAPSTDVSSDADAE
ncbi:MAG: DUF4236 domain-containing protein [Oscillibacter sp.]